MIRVVVYKRSNRISGFSVSGHAGYGEKGTDIVCAAVSAVVYTALGYMDEMLQQYDKRRLHFEEKNGHIRWERDSTIGSLFEKEVDAVLEAMVIGCRQIEASYGTKYVRVQCEEVHS